MDEAIPQSFRSWILCLLGVLGTLFVICLATPFFTILIVPLSVVYYFVQVSWPEKILLREKWKEEEEINCWGRGQKMFCLYCMDNPISVCTALLCGDIKTAASTRLSVTLSYILTLQWDGVRSVGDKSLRPSRKVFEAQRNDYRWKPEERLPMDRVKQVRYWFQVLLQNTHHHQIQTNICLKGCGSQCVSAQHASICVHVVCVCLFRLQMARHPSGVSWEPGGVFLCSVCRHFKRLFGQRPGWPVHILRS